MRATYAVNLPNGLATMSGIALALWGTTIVIEGVPMGRILLGVIIGIILVIWLLVSCVGAIL